MISTSERQKSEKLAKFILKNFNPGKIKIVEIGVFEGTNASIILKILSNNNFICKYYGFDLFENAKYYDLSKSNPGVYHSIKNNDNFIKRMSLNHINKLLSPLCSSVVLIKGDTKQTIIKMWKDINNADIYYIDGGHDYYSVKCDWENVKSIAKKNSYVIFDDVFVDDIARVLVEIKTCGYKIDTLDSSRKIVKLKEKK